MCAGHERPRQGPRSALANFRRSDLGLGERLRVTAQNFLRRARYRQSCCGHYGEPGC
jgi:hypothetical protein